MPTFLQVIKYGEPLDERQKDELRTAVEKLRRQMLRKSREYDCQILQERMELLHQAHQVIAANGEPQESHLASLEGTNSLISLHFYREYGTLKTRQRSREGRLKTWRKR